MSSKTLRHRFVESVPEAMDQGTLYIALQFNTMMHLCACGCRKEVVTPLSPKDWKIVYDGQSISVMPSIGNWAFECQSHYFIRDGGVVWAGDWSDKRIKDGRNLDLARKRVAKQLGDKSCDQESEGKSGIDDKQSFLCRLWKKVFSGQS